MSAIDTMARKKGEYAEYKIKALSPTHLTVLSVLTEADKPLTSRKMTTLVNARRRERGERGRKTNSQVTGRLSELGRVGLVKMSYSKVRLQDEKIMQFRFVKKPVWTITGKGKRAFELRRIP